MKHGDIMNSKPPILEELLERYRRFKRDVHREKAPLYKELAAGQSPRILFITCSDSRVVPSAILSAEPGDLFVCQVVGNIVPPYGLLGGVSVTVEYAVSMLEVDAIIVCGHSNCGAMGALAHLDRFASYPSIGSWLASSESAKRIVDAESDTSWDEARLVARLTEENVIAQLEHLETHPSVALARRRGLRIFGWVYDIESGDVTSYDPPSGRFVPLETLA